MESVDPLREGKAWVELINNKLRSPQEIVAARGRDYEEVLYELQEAKRIMEERGLTITPGSTAMKQNPAALGAEEGKKKKKFVSGKKSEMKGDSKEHDQKQQVPFIVPKLLPCFTELSVQDHSKF